MDDHHQGTKDTKVEDIDQGLSRRIIGLAIEVHRLIGPGLLESAYEECLCREFELAGLPFRRQVPVPVEYKGHRLECGYRLDLVVDNRVLLELKAIDHLLPIHDAQVLTYLRLTGLRIGLLMNFHALRLKDGVRRLVL